MSPRSKSGAPRRRVTGNAIRLELLLFVEGRQTEDMYITDWRRRFRDRVQVSIDEFRGGPLQLVEHAVRAKRAETANARRGRGRAHDQVWCMFDEDQHPNIAQALDLAERNGIHIAYSNPCLELWFVIHFQYQTAFIHRHEAQRISEEILLCSKTLTSAALDVLFDGIDQAKARAIQLEEKHAGDGSPPMSNPSSNVWKLIDQIRQA